MNTIKGLTKEDLIIVDTELGLKDDIELSI